MKRLSKAKLSLRKPSVDHRCLEIHFSKNKSKRMNEKENLTNWET